MYFAFGWPKTFTSGIGESFIDVSHNVSCTLIAMVSHSCVSVWSADQHRVQLGYALRSEDSVEKFGSNQMICWCPDSSSIAIITSLGFILVYLIEKESQDVLQFRYLKDHHHSSHLLHDKRRISIKFSSSFKPSQLGAQCITGNTDYIYIFTKEGYLVKSSWTGELISQFSLDVVPFSSGVVNGQKQNELHASKSPLVVTSVFYSHLAPIFGLVFEDGSCAILKKRSKDRLHGYWLAKENAVSVSLNIKHRLAAVGLQNGEILIYKLPGPITTRQQQKEGENNDGSECQYLRKFSLFEFREVTSEEVGPISVMQWTHDGNCLAVGWKNRGLCIWSVYGCKLTCTIPQMNDSGFSEPCREGVLSLSWGPEGYHLVLLSNGNEVGEFLQLAFVKSSLSSNPNLNNSERIILQSEDRLMFLNYKGKELGDIRWKHLQIPSAYLNDNWPIKHISLSRDRTQYAVAGKRGIILYNSLSKRWKMFGDRSQEQSIQSCSLAWYRHAVVVASLHPTTQKYEFLFYPKQHLDSSSLMYRADMPATTTPLSIDCNDAHLALLTTECSLYLYRVVERTDAPGVDLKLVHLLAMAVPAPPLSLSLLPPTHSATPHILMLHHSGRLELMHGDNAAQFNLGSGVEAFWMSNIWPQLRDAGGTTLWVYGGAGIGVWFPFGAPSTHASDAPPAASSLAFDSEVYPVGCVAELGVIAGLAQGIAYTACSPYPCYELRVKTHPFLHSILKHLLTTRGGADMAWSLSSKFSTIPHFTHSLELLLHETMADCDHKLLVKGGNSTSSRMQYVVSFLRRFPQFPEVVMRCARKIDVSLWRTLFTYVGDPMQLYTKCLASGKTEIAASYLKILQNLVSNEYSRKCAIDLLEIVLDLDNIDMAGDLVRFLDPEEDDDLEAGTTAYKGEAEKKQMEFILSTYASKLLKSRLLRNFLLFSRKVGVPIGLWFDNEKKSTILRTAEDLDMALNSIHVQFYITLPSQTIPAFSPNSVLSAFSPTSAQDTPNHIDISKKDEDEDGLNEEVEESNNTNEKNSDDSKIQPNEDDIKSVSISSSNSKPSTTSSSKTSTPISIPQSMATAGEEASDLLSPMDAMSIGSPLTESISRDEMIESLKSRIQVTTNDHFVHKPLLRSASTSSGLVKSISTEMVDLEMSKTQSEAIYSFKSHQFMIAPSSSNVDSNDPSFLQDSIDSSMDDLYYLLQELTSSECYEWVLVIATVLLNTTLISKALKKLPNIYENYCKMLSCQKSQGYSQLLKFIEDTIHPFLHNMRRNQVSSEKR